MEADIKTTSAVVLAACILLLGFFILRGIADEKTTQWRDILGRHVLQIIGLTFILPVVLVVSVAITLNSQAITALLGAIMGSIFGSAAAAGSSSDKAKSAELESAQYERLYAGFRNEMGENSARSDRKFNELIETLSRQHAPPMEPASQKTSDENK